MIDRLAFAMVLVGCVVLAIWLNRKEKAMEFKGFNHWRRWTDRITILPFVVAIASTLSMCVGWKLHFNNVVENILTGISMLSLGMTLFLMLRYIGMPSDEDVEKYSPGWLTVVQKKSSGG